MATTAASLIAFFLNIVRYLIANGFEVDDAIEQVKVRVRGALKIDEQKELVRTFALR